MGQAENNIGYICTKMQCDAGLADKTAFRWISADYRTRIEYSYRELDQYSNQFANVLAGLNVQPGDIVFTFLPKIPEQFFTFLGILKLTAIAGTLFANFGEDALVDRLAEAKCLITKRSLLKRVLKARIRLPNLKIILLVDAEDDVDETILSYPKLMQNANREFDPLPVDSWTPSVLHYTSGSTGKPKGVLHTHGSIISQQATSRDVLQLSAEDVYWCTADQGWVTGTSYGIIGPWSLGVTQIHYGGGFDAEIWLRLLTEEKITTWYTAPTALRMLMRVNASTFERAHLESLNHIFSVGEPLNPEVIQWGRRVLGKDIYDTWFQTETGSIMIANRPGLAIRPGSMGQPVQGIQIRILTDDGTAVSAKGQGNLCIVPGWPSMFVNYLNNLSSYQSKFRHGHYFTGDMAYQDEDGYFWFLGRNDDVINPAGHLVSPFEVESALLECDEVVEAAVIGVPDPEMYEKVVAYVTLQEELVFTPDLQIKLRLYIANHVSAMASPQEILQVDEIPKNKSGKILRRVMKARYLGSDPGDISTLEGMDGSD